jgi:hypothetical protein
MIFAGLLLLWWGTNWKVALGTFLLICAVDENWRKRSPL